MTHKFSDDIADDVLANSSIENMEKITGKHWSEFTDEENRQMLALAFRESGAKQRVLESRDDNAFGCKLPDFERIIADIGFRQVLQVDFQDRHEPRMEALKVWWLDKDGLLLQYDTYYGQQSVSSGNFGYNWRMRPDVSWEERCGVTSSSSPLSDGIIAGSHDCREAMRRKIERLRQYGEFIVPWHGCGMPYLSLLHYADFDNDTPMRDRLKAGALVSLSRAEILPAGVREATGLVEYFKKRTERDW
jgi:hypothetical protein